MGSKYIHSRDAEKRRARYKTIYDETRKQAFDVIGHACIWCGTTERVEAAHVIPTAVRGQGKSLKRWRDVLANPRCYRPMCVTHHRVFDALVAKIKVTIVVEEPVPF